MTLARTIACLGLLAVFAGTALTEDVDHTIGAISVKVLGRSGKIRISTGDDRTKDITFEVDSITELDGDGNDNGNKVTTFASKDFSFTSLKQSDSYDGVAAGSFSFKADNIIDGKGNLTFDVYVFTEDGVISIGGENTTVSKGSVKANALVSGWPFKASGEFLDLATIIKGKNAGAKAKKDERKNRKGQRDSKGRKDRVFDLGDSTLVVSEKAIVDGSVVDLPAGYPVYETKGNKQMFLFRLPKGDEIMYDPIVDADGVGEGSSAATAAMAWLIAAVAVVVAC